MDIDKFAFACCEACIECNKEKESKICLSCKKLMFYEAIKDGIESVLNGKDYFVEESIKHITDCIDNLSSQIDELGYEINKLNSKD